MSDQGELFSHPDVVQDRSCQLCAFYLGHAPESKYTGKIGGHRWWPNFSEGG
jgi:hypothetical protein